MSGGAPSPAKARILAAARTLFNEEGVGGLSALDIATALGISPGHLYYHFKGKPEILAALVEAYAAEVDLVLAAAAQACAGEGANLETLWAHLHILAEEAWDARFLYREAGGIALRWPDIGARIRAIAAGERAALRAILDGLAGRGLLAAPAETLDALAALMTTAIGFQAIELELEGDPGPPRARIARAIAQVMALTAGFAV